MFKYYLTTFWLYSVQLVPWVVVVIIIIIIVIIITVIIAPSVVWGRGTLSTRGFFSRAADGKYFASLRRPNASSAAWAAKTREKAFRAGHDRNMTDTENCARKNLWHPGYSIGGLWTFVSLAESISFFLFPIITENEKFFQFSKRVFIIKYKEMKRTSETDWRWVTHNNDLYWGNFFTYAVFEKDLIRD